MIIVAAALLENAGRLLICQRRRGGLFPLKWEFPGGKAQPDETPARALARELREELGIEARLGREVYRTRHRYPEYPEELELIFFAARTEANELEARGFEQVRWVEPCSLPDFDFLPADAELVRRLVTGALRFG